MIEENIKILLKELPPHVALLAATKKRSVDEIKRAINAGVRLIGENYVQEAAKKKDYITEKVEWHLIGHLQRNKVKKACEIFDVIESVDSIKIATELSRKCGILEKKMPVMIEINSGREENKTGIFPEDAEKLAEEIDALDNLELIGIMTMGPAVEGEEIRKYFRITREIFESLKDKHNIKYLSMGMTDSWKIAVEEGANIVRIGRGIFGPR